MNGGCPLHVSGIPSKAGTQAIRAFYLSFLNRYCGFNHESVLAYST